MKWIAALILLALSVTATAEIETTGYRANKIRYDMWLMACEYTPYVCRGVKTPKVKYEYMRAGLYGYYDGGDTVYVNSRIYGLQRRATILHEMIHYLQSVVGGTPVPGPAKLICQMEAEAFKLVDQWWVDIGYARNQRGPSWWRPYRHCHRWYNPDYPNGSMGYGWW